MFQLSMQLDLFPYCRIIFTDCFGNSRLGRTMSNARFNDPPLLISQMSDVVGIHDSLPFSRHCQGFQLYGSVRLISMYNELDSRVRFISS